MKLIDYEFKNGRLLLILVITAAVAAGQLFLMKRIRHSEDALIKINEKALRANAGLEARLDAVMRCKRAVRLGPDELPSPAASQGRLYSELLSVFSLRGFESINIEKESEAEGEITFRISGSLPYASLMSVLSSFRQSRHLIKITNLSLDGKQNDIVSFALSVAAVTEKAASEQAGDGKKAQIK